MSNKNAIVLLGRFQPPTAGHYHVIDQMKKHLRESKDVSELFIVVIEGEKSSQDKSKNPLTADDRIKFMKASGFANGIKFLKAGDAVKAFEAVQAEGYHPLVVAAGSDRAKAYLDILDKHFPTNVKHRAVPGLDREESDEPSMDMDVKTITGTAARHAAQHDFYDEFAEIVGLQDKPILAKKLFNRVRSAMSDGESQTQKE